MKKLTILCVICLCVSPTFAQADKAGDAAITGVKAATRGAELAAGVTRKVAAQVIDQAAFSRLAQIVNLPSKPPIKFRAEQVPTAPYAAVAPVRLLTPLKMRKIVFDGEGLYVPEKLGNSDEWLLFRGMQFNSLAELENMMRKGLEISKSNYKNKIHTTPALNIALGYTFPSRYSSVAEEGKKIIPVLVTIPYTQAMERGNSFYADGFQYVFEKDVAAQYMGDVFVFWALDKKPGWHKVTLENNELLFTPVPGTNITLERDL